MSAAITDQRYIKALEYFKMKKIPTIEEIESARFLKEKKDPLSIFKTNDCYEILLAAELEKLCANGVDRYCIIDNETFTDYKRAFIASAEERYKQLPNANFILEDEVLSNDLKEIRKMVKGYIDAFYDIHNVGDFKHGIRMFYTEYQKQYEKYMNDYAEYYLDTFESENKKNNIRTIVSEAKNESLANPFNASLATKNTKMHEQIKTYRDYKNKLIMKCGEYFQKLEYQLQSEEYKGILSSEYEEIKIALDEMSDEILEQIDRTVVKDDKQLEETYKYLINSLKLDKKLFLEDLFDNAMDNFMGSIKKVKDKQTRNEIANEAFYANTFEELAALESKVSGTRAR